MKNKLLTLKKLEKDLWWWKRKENHAEMEHIKIGGFEVCRRLNENPFFQTPIVFVSGRCCIEDQQHGLDVGAADYITKPFETFEFAPRLLSHVERAGNVSISH